jgi:hypothetical protein
MSRVWLVILLAVPPLGGTLLAEPAELPPPLRELHVPFDEVRRILAGPQNSILLPRARYEGLRGAALRRSRSSRPPQSTTLGSADCRIELRERVASFTATLGLTVLAEGVHAIPVRTEGIDLLAVTLDGEPAGLWTQGGIPHILVSGKGAHSASLSGLMPVATDAARQTLSFALPEATAMRLRVSTPGDVRVKSGAAVRQRSFAEEADRTDLELVPTRGTMQLVLSRNRRRRQSDTVVETRSVMLASVGEYAEELHATVSLDIPHGAIRQLRFALPEGFSITSVTGANVAQWGTEKGMLDVSFRGEVTEHGELWIAGLRTGSRLGDWQFPALRPQGVLASSDVLGILLDDRLETRDIRTQGLMPIPTPATLADRLGLPAGRMRPVAFYYAPRGTARLAARIVKPKAAFRIGGNQLLTVADAGFSLSASFVLSPEYERVFAVDVLLPQAWQVESVTSNGRPVPIESHLSAGINRVRVPFAEGAKLGEDTPFTISARWVPKDWLGNWGQHTIAFPDVRVAGAREETGALAVVGMNDFEVKTTQVKGLTPLDQQERAKYGLQMLQAPTVFRYATSEHELGLALVRRTPRVTGETLSFFVVGEESLQGRYELIYHVERARVRKVVFSLPDWTPAALSVTGLSAPGIKEYSSTEGDGRRTWTTWLAGSTAGDVRLAVEFQMALPTDETAELPLPVLGDVAYQSGRLSVEGEPDLDVRVVEHPRVVDIGELSSTVHRPGARLLGAYGFTGVPQPVRVSRTRHDGYPVPAVLVEEAELVSVFGMAGRGQHAVHYRLRSKLRFLDVALPEGADLWSVLADGKPLAPMKQAGKLLFELPAANGSETHDVVAVYETPARRFGLRGELVAFAPSLVLRDSSDKAVAVPVADLSWRVHLPSNFRLSGAGGTVAAVDLAPVTPAALHLGQLLYRATGGVSPSRGLISGLFLGALEGARSKARKISKMAEAKEHEVVNSMAYVGDEKPKAESPVPKPAPVPQAGPQRAAAAGTLAGQQMDDQLVNAMDYLQVAGSRDANLLALRGARSLHIALANDERGYLFRSLGERPELVVRVLDQRRLDGICWAVGLLVFLGGVCLTTASVRRKVVYVAGVLLVGGLVPALPGLVGLALVLNSVFYAGVALLPYYVGVRIVRRLLGLAGRLVVLQPRLASLVVLALLFGVSGRAEGTAAMEIVRPEPIKLPDDALVVPYGKDGQPTTDVVVPMGHFKKLQGLVGGEGETKPARPYAITGADYRCALADAERLVLTGGLTIEVFVAGNVFVPLGLDGAVFGKVELDRKGAALTMASSPDGAASTAGQAAVGIVLSGKGRHKLSFEVRVPIGSEGGWRRVDARIPGVGAGTVAARVPEAGMEVLRNVAGEWSSHVSAGDGEELAVPLGRSGHLRLQWRPKTGEAVADPTLTAESRMVFTLREDQVRLSWHVALSFRRGQREVFSFAVPSDYVVENVTGENVRGWHVQKTDTGQTVTVTALKAAVKSENLSLELRREGLGEAVVDGLIAFPALRAVGAVRHTGTLLVRHSRLLDVRLAETGVNVRRMDVAKAAIKVESGTDGPVQVRDYAAFELVSLPCQLGLSVSTVVSHRVALVRSILRLSRRERLLESRIEVSRLSRPLYELGVSIPPDLAVKDVRTAARAEWYLEGEGAERVLVVRFPDGVADKVALSLDGQLPGELGEAALPRLVVAGDGEQRGELVVQSDPGLEVEPVSTVGLERAMLHLVYPWLNPKQRELTRLAYRYGKAPFQGVVRVRRRATKVTASTVTNVRVTDRMIEETSLVTFRIEGGGARQLLFRLPASQADAEIQCPLLRNKLVMVMGDEAVVRLTLQDEVVGVIKVLVRLDRERVAGEVVAMPPTVDTGRTLRRILVAESAGRDEVVVDVSASVGLDELSRQSQHWGAVSHLLGKGTGQAFLVRATEARPQMVLRIERRESVETAGARIGLAQTVLMMDNAGAFRGVQTFYVDNRTEPYLQVELPAGAVLWAARVADQLVKPVWLDASAPRRVSIPLVKTAEGDLDYQVVLKYGGRTRLPKLGGKVVFPVIAPLNVTPERSQLELRLPRERQWFQFAGTMGVAGGREQFQAGYLAYQNVQAKRLVQALQSSNDYARQRAQSNLKRLKSKFAATDTAWADSKAVAKEQSQVRETLDLGEQQVAQQAANAATLSNSAVFQHDFAQQKAQLAGQAEVTAHNWSYTDADKAKMAAKELGKGKGIGTDEEAKGDRKKAGKNWRQGQNRALIVQQQVAPVVATPSKAPTEFYSRANGPNPQAGQYAGFAPVTGQVWSDLGEDLADVAPTGLASLDVAFPKADPKRWETVRLATPRGDMTVTARGLNRGIVLALQRLGLVLLAFAAAFVPVVLFLAIRRAMRADVKALIRTLVIVGLISVFFGIFPAVGILFWLVALGLKISAVPSNVCPA